MHNKGVAVIFSLLLLMTVMSSVLNTSKVAGDNWFNASWSYRKYHVINPSAGAGTNYQMNVTVHYGSGTDDGANVYLNGNCRSDFGDVRFTRVDGTTLLNYWVQDKTNGDKATFWVNVADDLSSSGSIIYLYYGNPLATSTSNGATTFMIFDDFETDLSAWSIVSSSVISTDHAYSGTKCVKCNIPLGDISRTISKSNALVSVRYYDAMSTSTEDHYMTVQDSGGSIVDVGVLNDISHYEYSIGMTTYDSGVVRTVGWHEFEARHNAGTIQFQIDGVLMPNTDSGGSISIVTLGNGAFSNVPSYWDAFCVRKFVSPEPTQGRGEARTTVAL